MTSNSSKGLWTVNEAQLRAMPVEVASQWFASGELGLIYAHLISLGNLLELLRRQPRSADALAASSSIPSAVSSTSASESVQ